MLATLEATKVPTRAQPLGHSRGYYRVQVSYNTYTPLNEYHYKGFSQIVKICKALDKVKADYTVNWDDIDTGVLILFTKAPKVTGRPRAVKKATRPKPVPISLTQELPNNIDKNLAKWREAYVCIARNRRMALMGRTRTVVSAEDGRQWHTTRVDRQRLGRGLAKWIAQGERLKYAELDALFGARVKRESQVGVNEKCYKTHLINQAKRIGVNVWAIKEYPDRTPDTAYIRECVSEIEYWLEMRKLARAQQSNFTSKQTI